MPSGGPERPDEMRDTTNDDVSRTVPRRGLPREAPRVGLLIVVGSGAAPETLRAPRTVVMEDLALEIGRRPPSRRRPRRRNRRW